MAQIAYPNEYPLVQVKTSIEFSEIPGLEELMNKFPYSSRDPVFLKQRNKLINS